MHPEGRPQNPQTEQQEILGIDAPALLDGHLSFALSLRRIPLRRDASSDDCATESSWRRTLMNNLQKLRRFVSFKTKKKVGKVLFWINLLSNNTSGRIYWNRNRFVWKIMTLLHSMYNLILVDYSKLRSFSRARSGDEGRNGRNRRERILLIASD